MVYSKQLIIKRVETNPDFHEVSSNFVAIKPDIPPRKNPDGKIRIAAGESTRLTICNFEIPADTIAQFTIAPVFHQRGLAMSTFILSGDCDNTPCAKMKVRVVNESEDDLLISEEDFVFRAVIQSVRYP